MNAPSVPFALAAAALSVLVLEGESVALATPESAGVEAPLSPPVPDPADGGIEAPAFTREVRPILADKCVQCHGPDEAAREGGVRLDRPGTPDGQGGEGWTTAIGGGAAVVPGDPDASLLLERVRASGKRRMPPLDHGDALTTGEIDVLERWIAAGARYDEHWAYAPFQPVEPPSDVPSADEWTRNPIDAFVLAQLVAEGLEPAPEADREALLRRVSFDLTGLPPTPEQIQAFEDDLLPGAFERVVDRLLESEAYAEHWTRAWMDLARYADSHGFTIDGGRSMWPWRDWVLRSVHADEPYDRFTLRQLAGDLLPGATNADVIATGFHRNTQVNQEGGAKDEENRVNAVHDRVATTAAVWLGTTASCAQCHDHKFDPLPTKDYYRLFAFFDSTEDGGVRSGPAAYVASNAEQEAEIAAFERAVSESRAALASAAEEASPGWTTWQGQRTKADNGPELVAELDGSYRVVGQNAVYTVYEVAGAAPADGVSAIRIEALPSIGLSGNGPGRSNGGNFVLTGVSVEWRPGAGSPWQASVLSRAAADHEQDTRSEGGGHYPAAHVLDGDDRTGWAIKPSFGRPHVLHLTLEEPVPAGASELRIALEQKFGDSHSLGRFRLRTAAVDASGAELAPPSIPEAWPAAFTAAVQAARRRPALPTSLVLRERPVPRSTHVFLRGSYLDPGEPVEPGVPGALAHLVPRPVGSAQGDGAQRLTRLDLARWLTHPDNALVHRVTVNRWWQAFFGVGLVATENDFGLRGAEPSHGALLEWLAREFVRGGFSRKAVHRLIVTSATYRQAVPAHGDLARRDPDNRLLARQRRLRLPAESVRDAALSASGLLAQRFGGPPVQPPQPDGVFAFTQSSKSWKPDEGPDRFRRTLYTRIWRSSVFPFLATFDAPAPTVACTRRDRSTSPLQALTLANDPMILELAAGLGARARSAGDDDAERVERAFQLALGRVPSAREAQHLQGFLEGERERQRARGHSEEVLEASAWTALGRVLFNLDEFVTRP